VNTEERALRRTVHALARRTAAERDWVIRRLTAPEKRTLNEFWFGWAHKGQALELRRGEAAPATWSIVAGRGFGKTRAGAEWVSDLARKCGTLRIALVGATLEDVRKVMIAGESGLIAVAQTGEKVRFNKTQGVVRFASGAQAFVYSGACPEKLRGPEHHVAWCDEIAKWRYPEVTWDNLSLGLRLRAGAGVPQTLVTTTPRPVPFLKKLIADSKQTGGRTADNRNLPAAFVARMEAAYGGTRKGRAELDGVMVEDVEGALWTRALVEACRVAPDPSVLLRGAFAADAEGFYRRIVIGVDPPASAEGDACGIVACGLGADGVGYVLGDHSVRGLSPEGWAGKVAEAAEAWGADCVIVEKNQGGDMATSVLKAADPALPVRPVHARYGKGDRAEPVGLLFETGRAKFAGAFPELEDELCAMTRGGSFARKGKSPDRADAMVWAMTELMLGVARAAPRVRGF
jgi:phage terminase large subunit-like protein